MGTRNLVRKDKTHKKGLMKNIMICLLLLSGCGYTSRNNELVGQVKKVVNNTPVLCPDYVDSDVSLGVLRNGVGSMSSEDVWLTVYDHGFMKILQDANASGALVKIKYDVLRFTWCVEPRVVTDIEVVK